MQRCRWALGLTHSKLPPKAVSLIRWDSRWFEMISLCFDRCCWKIIEIFRSRETLLKYFYIKISPLISSFPWWNLRLASGTFGICICAKELRICWAWLTHLPATALQQADQMVVVGWLGEGIPPYFRAMSNYHYATMLSRKQRKLIVVIVPLTSSSSKASYGCILYKSLLSRHFEIK